MLWSSSWSPTWRPVRRRTRRLRCWMSWRYVAYGVRGAPVARPWHLALVQLARVRVGGTLSASPWCHLHRRTSASAGPHKSSRFWPSATRAGAASCRPRPAAAPRAANAAQAARARQCRALDCSAGGAARRPHLRSLVVARTPRIRLPRWIWRSVRRQRARGALPVCASYRAVVAVQSCVACSREPQDGRTEEVVHPASGGAEPPPGERASYVWCVGEPARRAALAYSLAAVEHCSHDRPRLVPCRLKRRCARHEGNLHEPGALARRRTSRLRVSAAPPRPCPRQPARGVEPGQCDSRHPLLLSKRGCRRFQAGEDSSGTEVVGGPARLLLIVVKEASRGLVGIGQRPPAATRQAATLQAKVHGC